MAEATDRSKGALAGVRVLEVAQWWFVPAAGAVLADWGADVIKIEHPLTGDAQRGLAAVGFKSSEGNVDFMMQQSNRGKRSVGIDLAHPDGRELLYELARRSDVFLTNFLPSAREKLRIELEDIRAVNPSIVYVRGSGAGPDGPDRDKGGYDATAFWSRGAIAHALTPAELGAPVMQRAAFGDSIGAMTIAGGVAAALLKRERTGETSVVDVSLLATAMWVMAPDIVASKLVAKGQGGIPRFGRSSAPNPVGNSYQTKDGRWLLLMMLQADKHWADFCRHVGRPAWIDDERYKDFGARLRNREPCIAELDAIFAERTLADWREVFATLEGPWAPMQSAEEIHDDPMTVANGYLRDVDGGDKGRFKLVASPVEFDLGQPEIGPSPEHGQHTEEVLLELGLEWERILEHKKSGAVL
jgi:crotonobetainyl-CoA:carnitine CoA-transferase CaiB-like acyl-CoA transferase